MGRTMVLYSRLVVLMYVFSDLGQCGESAVCCLYDLFYLFSAELTVQCSTQVGVVFNCIEWGVIEK